TTIVALRQRSSPIARSGFVAVRRPPLQLPISALHSGSRAATSDPACRIPRARHPARARSRLRLVDAATPSSTVGSARRQLLPVRCGLDEDVDGLASGAGGRGGGGGGRAGGGGRGPAGGRGERRGAPQRAARCRDVVDVACRRWASGKAR